MAAEKNKDQSAITPTTAGGASTAVKPHKEHKGPSVKEHLAKTFDYVKKNTPRGTGLFIGVAIAAVLIILLFRYFWLSSAATASGRWWLFDQAIFVSEVQAVASNPELEGTDQARWAKLDAATKKVDGGLKGYGSLDRKRALEDLEEARATLVELSKLSGRSPVFQQRALWSAARATETLGDLPAATGLYQQLVTDHPNSALAKESRKALERLAKPGTKKNVDEIRDTLNPKRGG